MILQKREKFRSQIRRDCLERQFKMTRQLAVNQQDCTSDIQKYELLISANDVDSTQLQTTIPLLELTTNEELIVLILRYFEKLDLNSIPFNLPEVLLNKLSKTKNCRLQFYLIASMTNIISLGNIEFLAYFASKQFILMISNIILHFEEVTIIPNILECIAAWPYEFIKMNDTQDQISLLLVIQNFASYDCYNFYKILSKMTEEINREISIFNILLQKQFITRAMDDFSNNQFYIVDFFINLSFLDNEYLNQVVNHDFLSLVLFELNKPNKIQFQLFQLIRNLLLTDYSIRMFFYEFSIFEHLSTGIIKSIQRVDGSSLEEILTCLKILFLEDDVKYQNNQKGIILSDIENSLQSIFYSNLEDDSIYNLALEVLYHYYTNFSFNKNLEFKKRLNLIQYKIDSECFEAITNYLQQYD